MSDVNQEFSMDFEQPISNPFEVPEGTFLGVVKSSQMVRSKSNPANEFAEIVVEIVDGEHKGKQLTDRLNIKNASEKTAKLAQVKLRSLGLAVGLKKISHIGELANTGKAISFDVYIQKNSNPQFPDSPAIRSYYPVGANSQTVADNTLRTATAEPVVGWSPATTPTDAI